MSQTHLIEDLLDDIKLRSFAPISQDTFTDTKLMKIASDELRLYVTPLIMGARENFFLTYQDDSIVASKTYYPLSERSIGNSLKALKLVDANGKEKRTIERTTVGRIEERSKEGSPSHFFLQGDKIRLVPSPSKTVDSLRQYYFMRTSVFTDTIYCGKITGVSKATDSTTFTIDSDLTSSLSAGDKVDFQNAQSPFLLWAHDSVIEIITSTTIRVANADVVGGDDSVLPEVGDYITPAFETNIPQIPEVYHSVLAQRVAVVLLNSLGDRKKWETAKADLKEMEINAGKLIANRVEAQPQKVNHRNSIHGAIRGGR